MTILSKNIRYLRKQKGWSQDYIANKLGYKSFTTIQKWETGVSEPPIKKLTKLAELLSVDINDLVGKNLALPQGEEMGMWRIEKGIQVPVLGRVAAGIPIEAIEEIIDTEEIPEDMAHTGEFFGLQIHGNSMEPRMKDGDVVIVRQQSYADSGDIVIATVNGTDATCKKLKRYEEGIALISTNPAYDPMYFSNEEVEEKPVRILGKVVELRAKL